MKQNLKKEMIKDQNTRRGITF